MSDLSLRALALLATRGSHLIRSPLGLVKTVLTDIERGLSVPPEDLHAASSALHRIVEYLDELAAFGRVGEERAEPVNLVELVNGALQELPGPPIPLLRGGSEWSIEVERYPLELVLVRSLITLRTIGGDGSMIASLNFQSCGVILCVSIHASGQRLLHEGSLLDAAEISSGLSAIWFVLLHQLVERCAGTTYLRQTASSIEVELFFPRPE